MGNLIGSFWATLLAKRSFQLKWHNTNVPCQGVEVCAAESDLNLSLRLRSDREYIGPVILDPLRMSRARTEHDNFNIGPWLD